MRPSHFILLGVLSVSLVSGGVIVGGPADSNNCLPFDCPGAFSVTQYQQLYAASDFSGPITITGLTFFHTLFDGGNTLSSGTFTLSLSTVSTTLGAFTTILSPGGDDTQIFSGALPSAPFGGSFTLGGGSFAYDPLNGNLLLNILISGGSTSTGSALDASDAANGIFGRATNGTNSGNTGTGLVTQFEVGSSVPEPSSVSLGLFGLAALGLRLTRRR